MSEFKDKVTFEDVDVIRETAKALLVSVNGETCWIPKSQIDDDSEVYKLDTSGSLIISEWIASQKGLL